MSRETARVGVIGGSGVYGLPGLEEVGWQKVETPFGAPSDELLLARYQGREVVFLPRHGRAHSLLPSELNHRANVMALKQMGVRWIISASAVGSLQERYQPCDIVAIDQFFDRTKRSADQTLFGGGIVAHVAFADPICEGLRQLVLEAAREAGASVHDGGTYVNMEGPAFSTRAESIQNHRDGHAVIGMTNLGEAKCAREAEIAYAAMAMVTDYDGWRPHDPHVTVEAVIEYLHRNAETAQKVIAGVIERIDVTADCSCHHALDHAILTRKEAWPAEAVERLRPVIRRFLD